MDIDFHYYATYAAARLAGHGTDEAVVIAHAAQYVDDSTMAYLVDGNGAYYISDFRPVPTVHSTVPDLADFEVNPLRWGGSYLDNLRQVWSAFHFLPGNYGATPEQKVFEGPRSTLTWRFGKVEEDSFKMLCLPNSGLAGKMVNDIREHHLGQDYLLHLTGIRMHVLADTWAHMFYTGSPVWCVNDAAEQVFNIGADGRETEVVWKRAYYKDWSQSNAELINDLIRGEEATPPSLFANSVCYLGHGRMGHLPDYPWMTYRYKPMWSSQWIVKNNPDCYVKAFKQITWAMRCIRANTVFDPLDAAQGSVIDAAKEAVLREILVMQGDEAGRESAERRCKMWQKRLADLGLDVPPAYDPERWLAGFKNAGDKRSTDYYRFNRSARSHLDLVASVVKQDLGVTIDTAQGCVTVPLRLQSPTGAFVGALLATEQYYPRMDSKGVTLEFILESGRTALISGCKVRIRTTEAAAGKYSELGAWATPALYYYTPDSDTQKQGWIVHKVGGSDGDMIAPGDSILIENISYGQQNIQWYDFNDGYRYLTTGKEQPERSRWIVRLPEAAEAQEDARHGREPAVLAFGNRFTLQANNGIYLGAMKEAPYALTTQYYPRLLDSAISLVFENRSGASDGTQAVRDGGAFSIRTTESSTGDYCYLGAWDTTALYYYKKNYDQTRQGWSIEKQRGSPGAELRAGDVVRIRNLHYTDKPYLTYYQQEGQVWLTTKGVQSGGTDPQVEWVIRKA